MAKKRQRTDAERRARQCERLSRLLRVLRCIMGPGRWGIEGLARELECSPRTAHRILQTLAMAGVPWYFDKEAGCYRVRPGFKFPALEGSDGKTQGQTDVIAVLASAKQVLIDGERFLSSLRRFCSSLQVTEQ